MKKNKAIIIDLDQTLADISHRLPFIQSEQKDWKSFLHSMNILKDTINDWCRELIFHMEKSYKIIFVSGRNESAKEATIEWLTKHNILRYDLHMRPERDYRKDGVLKKEIYEKHIEPYFDILFVVEDRSQVVQAWRELGLVCLQCVEGNY